MWSSSSSSGQQPWFLNPLLCVQFSQLLFIISPVSCSNSVINYTQSGSQWTQSPSTLIRPSSLLIYSSGVDLIQFTDEISGSHVKRSLFETSWDSTNNWIRAFDHYLDSSENRLKLVWIDLVENKTLIYSAHLNLTKIKLDSVETVLSLNYLATNLAIDRRQRILYVSSKDENRIDSIDLVSKTRSDFLNQVKSPSDLFITESGSFLFYVENSTCLQKVWLNIADKRVVNLLCVNASQTIIAIYYDEESGFLYWILDDGSVYRKSYSDQSKEEQMMVLQPFSVYSTKKVHDFHPSALQVVDNQTHLLIYFCDSSNDKIQKTILTQSGENQFKLIESETLAVSANGVFDLKIIDLKQLYSQVQLTTINNIVDSLINSTITTSSLPPPLLPIASVNESEVALIDKEVVKNENEGQRKSGTSVWIKFIFWMFIAGALMSLIIIGVIVCRKKRIQRACQAIGDIKPAKPLRRIVSGSCKSSKKRTSSSEKVVSIEDLGGFSNASYEHPSLLNACDFCDYKDECVSKGICLSTYRLLDSVQKEV